jgi:hypothetical protein
LTLGGKRKRSHAKTVLAKKPLLHPLKLNLQENPSETYPSCPYCLTKFKTTEDPPRTDEKTQEASFQVEQPKIVKKETKNKKNEKSSVCSHHSGYLSERSSKEQIPDDCLVCKEIVECMLKKMRE